MQWLSVDVRVEQLNLNIICTGLSMAELRVILQRVLAWLVRCMMSRQDIERCPCHPLGKADLRFEIKWQ